MPFQDNQFVRTQNFVRDRDLGPPDWTIRADKVDDEFENVASGLTRLKADIEDINPYTRSQADERFATKEALSAKLDKSGGTVSGGLAIEGAVSVAAPVTLGGKPGAAKGIVLGGVVTFDYADGNVQSIIVAGQVAFEFAGLPASGGALQINLAIQAGSITVAGTTWWELGGGEKSTAFADLGIDLKSGRPYRMIVEMVAGYRAGIFQ